MWMPPDQAAISAMPARNRHLLMTRVALLLDVLEPDHPAEDLDGHLHRLAAVIDRSGPETIWLALAVLDARLPDDRSVVATHRRVRARGSAVDSLRRAIEPYWGHDGEIVDADVRIVENAVVVDVHDTSLTTLATGIQRVARKTAARWVSRHDIELIGWTADHSAFRELDEDFHARAIGASELTGADLKIGLDSEAIVVPWNSVYVMAELVAEASRSKRLLALARHSTNHVVGIGFDCVPIMSGETSAEGMPASFAGYLAAARYAETIATISHAAAAEYSGWCSMLVSTGLRGPRITPVVLPTQPEQPEPEGTPEDRFRVGTLPIVLCVGSHEPRKNHLAVLHAAELLWRRGRHFSLLFIGGNSWKSDEFHQRVNELRDAGRIIELVTAIDDNHLWGAYRAAYVSVFPSLNEGFGLPVAESLAVGTPVITSNFGSMEEIVDDGGGAITVDPRDDHAIADALERVLTDADLHERLVTEAKKREGRTWDDYTEELWDALVAPLLPPSG